MTTTTYHETFREDERLPFSHAFARGEYSGIGSISHKRVNTRQRISYMTFTKVVIVGATGNVGKPITNAFIEKKFDVLVISRDAAKAKEVFHDKVKYAELKDYNDVDAIAKVLQGYEVVISTLSSGNGGLNEQVNLIKAAQKAKVTRFVPSEWAWENSVVHVFEEKAKIRKQLESSGLEWTYFIVGYFSEYIWSPWFGWDVEKNSFKLIGSKDSKISFTDLPTIGKYAAAFINHPSSKNAYVRFAADTVTYGEAQAKLEKWLGKKITIEYTDPEIVKAKFEKEGKSYDNLFDQLKYDIGTSRVVVEKSQNSTFPEIKGKTFEEFHKK